MQVTVVPWDHDFLSNGYFGYDALFLSNGPGDPTVAKPLIDRVRTIMRMDNPPPVYGICMGNQIMALAAGMWGRLRTLYPTHAPFCVMASETYMKTKPLSLCVCVCLCAPTLFWA